MRAIPLLVLALSCGHGAPGPEEPGGREQPPELAGLFDRLEPPRVTSDAPADLVLRDGPPVPEPGHEEAPFPPPAPPSGGPPPAGATEPLRVLSYAPRGADELIGAVRVTFSQPMVPLAALSDLSREDVPLRIEPLPPGRFRWLGTTTLAFEPEGRMPLSTEYRATIAAGTRSAIGGALEQPVEFRFVTPPPALVSTIPVHGAESIGLDPVVALCFNQRVDPAVIAAATTFTGAGAPALRLLPAAEVPAVAERLPQLQACDERRRVVFRVAAPLAKGEAYTLRVAAGTRGAEGPRPIPSPLVVRFTTYHPLRIEEASCTFDPREPCRPGNEIGLRFNNAIASTELDDLVTVQPEPPRLERRVEGSIVWLGGDFAARTSYRVTVKSGIEDAHGQRLGADDTRDLPFADAWPSAVLAAESIATLELGSARALPVQALNVRSVRARVAAVPRARLGKALEVVHERWEYVYERQDVFAVAGIRPATHALPVRAARNVEERVGVPIGDVIPAGRSGYALVEVKVRQGQGTLLDQLLLVQATDLGVVAHVDPYGAVVRVTSLSTGRPVAGAEVTLADSYEGDALGRGRTDAAGVARLEAGAVDTARVVVRHGDDEAVVVVNTGTPPDGLVGEIFTDRDPYRPGDTVHLRVVARRQARAAAATIERTERSDGTCIVIDAHGQRRGTRRIRLGEHGADAFHHELAGDAATGPWAVQCTIEGLPQVLHAYFRVEEYRAPEIEVEVEGPEGPLFHGGRPALVVHGRYLFGSPSAGLPVHYTVGREEAEFAPPGHPGYRFGDQTDPPFYVHGRGAWLPRHGRHRTVYLHDQPERQVISEGAGLLDDEGQLRVPVELAPGDLKGPVRFVLEAEVLDPSRQTVAGRTAVVSHPSAVYVGLRSDRPFVRAEDPIRVSAIVAGIDGAIALGREIGVRAIERRSRLVSHREGDTFRFDWVHDEREVGRCQLRSAAEAAVCRIAPQRPGSYVIEAQASDRRGRSATTRIPIHVFGNGFVPYGENDEPIELLPDRTEYAAGDTARVLVRVPFTGGRGLLSIERAGAVETRPLDLDGSIQQVEVPITDALVPGATLRVSVARGRATDAELRAMLEQAGPDALRAAADDIGRPAWASGTVTLPVSVASKRLAVEVTPDAPVRGPGDPLRVTVRVREPGGEPADAEVTVMAVDEGVLSLLGWETPDLLDGLHPAIESSGASGAVHSGLVRRREMRELGAGGDGTIGLGRLGTIGHGSGSGYGRGAGGLAQPRARANGHRLELNGGGGAVERQRRTAATRAETAGLLDESMEAPATARNLFATTAFYRAAATTDEEGVVRVRFELPDNLTTFRLMAVAVGRGDHAGSGQGEVQVRKTILLRPALPRFATYGDRFEAAVVVHNETGRDNDVVVGIRAAGLETTGDTFRRVTLRAGEAREVAFPVDVVAGGGAATVQFAAAAEGGSDAVETTLPLNEPATSEAFATYGSIEDGVFRVPLEVPEGVVPRWGRLEVKLSSTALTGLDDAASYLFNYPYACAEQHAARLIAAAALHDVLQGRDDAGRAHAAATAATSIRSLLLLQHWDGGFLYWPGGDETELYTSAWVTYALLEARRAGFAVDDLAFRRALAFLLNRLENPRTRFSEHLLFAVQALALYTRAEAEQENRNEHVARVWSHRDELPVFARAWLLGALHRANAADPRAAELWRQIENGAVETPAGAHFAEDRVESARLLWHSERRTDAIVLGVMLRTQPEHPLVEKTATAVVAARRDGRWATTQENAWALSALVRYFRAREQVVPDLVVQSWLGSSFLGRSELRGRSGRVIEGSVPMSALLEIGDGDLVVAPEGQGRLYYRLGLRYATTDMRLPPEEQGFSITRSYEATEDPEAVRRDDDGVWHVRAGAVVRVRVVLVVPDDRYDVAIDDPLPAGFEAVNMSFETTATQRLSAQLDDRHYDAGHWWAWFAFAHRELRDDRVVAFARHAPAGVYEVTYLARATTPGRFLASPSKVEEMYAPEVFGRAASDLVVVDR